ncbi:single-strand DNA-binding protein [Leptospira weilii str. Ecochallenge]|uniref:Single-strand DNA-binding protein n=1 Tax=Leptospira weilii str. Ecochallenge TaxID=1049986 RepID=N1TYT1_9LEPT|nr:single-strand DNA-binding protein [Leptospira weilii str. Ecochallenge]
MLKRSEYIEIDSISSVDPNALSLGQLSQKFIDKQGNRFALRFNRNTRRAEFVRITLESPNEAQKHKHVPHPTHSRQSVKPIPVQKISSLQEIMTKTQEQSSVKIPKSNSDSAQTTNEVEVQKNVFQKTAPDRHKSQESSGLDLETMDLNILESPAPKQDLGEPFLKMEYDSVPSFIEVDVIEKKSPNLQR